MADETPPVVVNLDALEETPFEDTDHYRCYEKDLTPALRGRPGHLGGRAVRVPPGKVANPFHAHRIEDEIFFVLSGEGVLRYGDAIHPLRAGDCVSCPSRTGVAHQLASTGETDLVFLAFGANDPNEVCVYPDSGKVMVRSLEKVGRLAAAEYFEGEPDPPRILALAATAAKDGG